MEEVLEFIARSVVEKPDKVEVNAHQSERGTVLELSVDPDDLGRVIGKSGRVAKATRSVMKAIAMRRGERVMIEILS